MGKAGKTFDLLRSRGLQRGVFGSSRGWLAIWVGLTAAKQLHKHLGKEPVLVDRVVLKPGQRLVIEDTAIEWGKSKR